MAENEIITQQDSQMQLFAQLTEGILKKLERYCATARPMLGGEVYLTGEEVCRAVTAEFTNTSGLSGQRYDSLLQNRGQDTLQAKRHTSDAQKALLSRCQEIAKKKQQASYDRNQEISKSVGQKVGLDLGQN